VKISRQLCAPFASYVNVQIDADWIRSVRDAVTLVSRHRHHRVGSLSPARVPCALPGTVTDLSAPEAFFATLVQNSSNCVGAWMPDHPVNYVNREVSGREARSETTRPGPQPY
jgi:hypothetical protein